MKFGKKPRDALFNGDSEMFREIASQAEVYGEYGVGDSTKWVLNNTGSIVLSVDTSREWIEAIRSHVMRPERWEPHYIDVGAVHEWGRPVGLQRRSRFLDYASSLWHRDASPDVVLIDGRFRVLCFLVSLLNAKSGTLIVFDDYVDRLHYRVVEEFVEPIRVSRRQGLFEVRHSSIDAAWVRKELVKFSYFID